MVNRSESAEALRQPFHFDHRLRHKDDQENRKVERLVPKPMARAYIADNRSTLLPAFLIH